jgi:hypothetical protein
MTHQSIDNGGAQSGNGATSLDCLQKILDQTQETIRAYDTKAEVLAIILPLVVGVINSNVVNENCKMHIGFNLLSFSSILLAILTLFTVGMVLRPRKDLFRQIDAGAYAPKQTYFVSLQARPDFRSLDEYLRQVDATDWKRELAFAVLVTSCIRDKKHYWFNRALSCAALTLLVIILLLIGVVFGR